MQTDIHDWLMDLNLFMVHGPVVGLRDPFFTRVAQPMWHAHAAWLNRADPDRYEKALEIIEQCAALDWRKAAREWLKRRQERAAQKKEVA